ncbi:hypothetical protein A2V80_00675 [Candidatus Woesebacteria bacterium RBG_16_39_8b]|uniref:Uncharacterized protein n=1 Tax=Candidatus Woesebacteria bacterium RBG_16_39_8b TaxID=1802482 RepID=A0A1F7XGZ0_9BACT|nr:MAG: hypothetical protein A2V80_00675 [Candidatus Woesebacteria bacterium RBG_16_39_8b]
MSESFGQSVSDRVLARFNTMNSQHKTWGNDENLAASNALDQTLIPGGLKDAGVKTEDLTPETRRQIAEGLVNASGGSRARLKYIIAQIDNEDGQGDPATRFNYGRDERIKMILDEVREVLKNG